MTISRKTRKAAHGNSSAERAPAGNSAKKLRRSATGKGPNLAVRPGTKQADLAALLRRRGGATIEQLCAKTGWQAHSVRASLTGFRKRGFDIIRGTNKAGTTVYSIASQREGTSS